MEAKVEDELGRGSQPPSRWDHENLAEVINLLQTLAMSGDLERPREFHFITLLARKVNGPIRSL